MSTKRQHGVIMATAAIFLLFLTIVGTTLWQASALEQRMAGNTQQSHRTFHAAEAGLYKAFQFALAHRPALPTEQSLEKELLLDGVSVHTATHRLAAGNTLPRGFSLRGGFKAHHYAIESHAYLTNGSHSTHTGGFVVVGPAER